MKRKLIEVQQVARDLAEAKLPITTRLIAIRLGISEQAAIRRLQRAMRAGLMVRVDYGRYRPPVANELKPEGSK